MSEYDNYFNLRGVDETQSSSWCIPEYLKRVLPVDKSAKILDIGCGHGQLLKELVRLGYSDVAGVDVSLDAVEFCKKSDLNVRHIPELQTFCLNSEYKHDLIIMSHLLEHLVKAEIISTLELIRTNLLRPGGAVVIMVPNAQSNTGCYWAYEDFTHRTLFTGGSLLYVLKAAGFSEIRFLDPDGLEGANPIIWFLKIILLTIYKANIYFWNRVTSSYFHIPSPRIFTYELKAIAK